VQLEGVVEDGVRARPGAKNQLLRLLSPNHSPSLSYHHLARHGEHRSSPPLFHHRLHASRNDRLLHPPSAPSGIPSLTCTASQSLHGRRTLQHPPRLRHLARTDSIAAHQSTRSAPGRRATTLNNKSPGFASLLPLYLPYTSLIISLCLRFLPSAVGSICLLDRSRRRHI
jgi:hypothetical protein